MSGVGAMCIRPRVLGEGPPLTVFRWFPLHVPISPLLSAHPHTPAEPVSGPGALGPADPLLGRLGLG